MLQLIHRLIQCICVLFEIISDNPYAIKLLFCFQMPELECSSTLLYICMSTAPTFSLHNVCVWGPPPSILLALPVRKRCQPSKSTKGGQRYRKKNIFTQITSEVVVLAKPL